jgi:hypothetical protein
MAIKSGIDASKVENLNGINFRMWKRKISYVLTHEKLLYTLNSVKPELDGENDSEIIKKQEKFIEDDLMAKATLLHNMKDNIIPLFEEYDTAKGMMEALDQKYGPRSDTHIQLLLNKYNNARMEENDYIGDYVNQMELVAKELSNAGHPVSDKMQVTTILNSLPLSWDHVVTSLTHSGKEISMTSLPVLLVLEEERMKRRRIEGAATNLLLAQTKTQKSNTYKFRGNKKKFNRKWKGKRRGNFKNKRACYRCGKTGHFKINCPKNNGGKEQKGNCYDNH